MSTKLNIKNICTSFLYKYIKDLVSVKTPIALVFIYYLYSNTWLMDYIVKLLPFIKNTPFIAVMVYLLLLKFIFLIYNEISNFINKKIKEKIKYISSSKNKEKEKKIFSNNDHSNNNDYSNNKNSYSYNQSKINIHIL
jgi:hypothetical protein